MLKIKDTQKRDAVYAALCAPTREIKNRITFGHYEVNPSKGKLHFFVPEKTIHTVSARITQDANGNTDGIAIGNACVSSFSCEFRNQFPEFLYSQKVAFIESGIKLRDSSFFYIPLGYFNCLQAQTNDDGKSYEIEGYDDIYTMSNQYKSGIEINENTTCLNLLVDLADRYAVELTFQSEEIKTLLASYKLPNADILTAYKDREVLGFLAGCVGCNARMTTEGKLYIGWFNESGFTIEPTVQWQEGFLKTDDFPFEVDSITSGIDEKVFTAGTGKGIEFPNPIINEQMVNKIYERIVTRNKSQWQPSSCTWRGNPCIEAGDAVSVKDKKGTVHKFYIATQEIELAGGIVSSIDCQSNSDKISFSTFDMNSDLAIKKAYTDMQEMIAQAAAEINGARGGYYRVLGKDKQPYGWECMSPNGLEGVKCTYGGIGCTTDGGKTYKTAITGKGVVGDVVNTGRITGGSGDSYFDLDTGELVATGVFTALGKNYNLKVSNHTFYPGDEIMEHDSLGLYKYDKSGNFDSAICFEDWTQERDPGISLITPKASAHLSQGGCVLTDDSNEAGDSSWKNRVLLSLSKKPSVFNTGIKTGYNSDNVENAVDHMYGYWREDNMGNDYINDSRITVSRKIQGSNHCPALDLKVEHVIYEQMGGLSPNEEVSAEMILYTSDTNYKDPQTESNASTISLGLYSCGVEIGHFTANIDGSLYWNGKKIV